jgi:hypothetical protein
LGSRQDRQRTDFSKVVYRTTTGTTQETQKFGGAKQRGAVGTGRAHENEDLLQWYASEKAIIL